MDEMLQDAGYPDQKLVSDFRSGFNGFSISGWLRQPHVFPKATKRPEHDMSMVLLMAKGLNKMILEQVSSQARVELATKTWQSTKEELEKGWVWLEHNGSTTGVVLAKRFGLEQKTKLRVIDDCTIGGWNKTCGSLEKLRIHAIDEMVAFIAWTMSAINPAISKKMVGKTYDLTSAYKQFGISAGDRELLRIATWNPEVNEVALLGVNALPILELRVRTSFLRVAMAVWFLGVRCLDFVWTCFFDDCTLLSQESSSASATFAAESWFKLLGSQYAQEGSKNTEFGKGVKTLGMF